MELKTAQAVLTYAVAFCILAVFIVVTLKMYENKIDLSGLILEADMSKASLSRFQLLLFTLVVAGLYLILSIENGQLIDIPNGVLGMLGISGGSFLVSKGISSKGDEEKPAPPDPKPEQPDDRGRVRR